MLSRLCLLLPGGGNIRHKGKMNVKTIFLAYFLLHLSYRLQKGCGLNIAYRTADLGNDKIGIVIVADTEYPGLDLIGNMGNDLHRTA